MICYSRIIISISFQKDFKIEFAASLYNCRALVEKSGEGEGRQPFVSCVNQAKLVLLAKVITWLSVPTVLSAE